MKPILLEPPPALLRFFDQEEYADDFVLRGKLRLRRLEYYRTVESSAARDEDEGSGRILVPGLVPRVAIDPETRRQHLIEPIEGHFHFSTSWANPTYVFCTSHTHVSVERMLAERPFPTVLTSPDLFADALNAALATYEFRDREVFRVEGMPVRYDKDAIAERPEDFDARIRLSIAQKSPRFAPECEYRFAVYLSGPMEGAPEFLDLQLAAPATFCVRGLSSAAV